MEKTKDNNEDVWMNFKLTKDLKKRVKSYVVSEEITIQDFLTEAVLEKLEKTTND